MGGRYGVLLSTPGNFMSIAIPPILIFGVVLVGVVILRGVDTKTLVAYSRVLHIAVGMMAWGSANFRGYSGTLFSNVAHTLLSPIVFLINAGMPPWILSAREVVMVLACKEKIALTLGVVLGIFCRACEHSYWRLTRVADISLYPIP